MALAVGDGTLAFLADASSTGFFGIGVGKKADKISLK